MGKKTTIVLAIVNAALLAFILVYERGTLSTSDTAQRSGQVLGQFVRDQVERVELVRGDDPAIVLVRERTEDEEEGVLDIGTWRLAEPHEGEADQDAVDSMLGALEWMTAQRTLTAITGEDRAQFGLEEPRFTVRFQVRAQTVEVRVGGAAPTGEGVYVGVVGEESAHVVSDDIVGELDHDLNHFRSKELFDGYFASDSRALELSGGGEPIHLERGEGQWRVSAPEVGWARAAMVDGLLRVLRRAQATRFVAEAGADLSEYGLAEPWRELHGSRADDVEENREARLRVGDVCGEHEDERYATAGDEGPVVCVTAGDVSALEVDREALRETRLLPIGDDAIEKIVVSRGDERIELRRNEADWELYVGPADTPSDAAAADDEAIAEWTGQLRDARAVAFEPLEEGAHGLDEPRVRITVHRSDREGTVTFRLGDASDDGAWMRRGDENAAVRYEADVSELFAVSGLRFRDRQVIDVEAGDAQSITVRQGADQEQLARAEGGWQLSAPLEAEADRVVVGELVRRFASLRAARLVSDAPTAEHGLRSPSAVVTLALEGEEDEPTRVALSMGATTLDGRFARAGDGPVFVIGQEDVAALTTPLVSRDLLTVVTEELSTLRIERETDTHELTRDGTTWQLAAGGAPHEARTGALLDRLGTLRATAVLGYGAATRELPTRVVATRTDGETVTLRFGAVEGEGTEAFVPARRDGLDVTYAMRPDAIAPIANYTP